jgi:hypothetical protein
VIGSRYSQDTFRIRDFLARNHVPFTWLDLESDPQVKEPLRQFGVTEADTPVVAWGRKLLLRNPSNRQLADAIGLRRPPDQAVYDLVVVGAGPAGLAAAVYGASEGLSTVVLERTAPGGQAGRSMRIENYLGFPTGISGSELAERAVVQANKFGARLPVGAAVTGLTFDHAYPAGDLVPDGGHLLDPFQEEQEHPGVVLAGQDDPVAVGLVHDLPQRPQDEAVLEEGPVADRPGQAHRPAVARLRGEAGQGERHTLADQGGRQLLDRFPVAPEGVAHRRGRVQLVDPLPLPCQGIFRARRAALPSPPTGGFRLR